jgi:hypothetical protein
MKKIITVLCVLTLGYQGYSQTSSLTILAFYPQIADTIEWTEEEIIAIIDKSEPALFCKIDLFLEKGDTSFYVKNMDFPLLHDSIFDSVYMESSIFYGEKKKHRKKIHCHYLIVNDKWGNQLELTEDALVSLPKLSKYLDKKVKKTRLKECKQGYVPLD